MNHAIVIASVIVYSCGIYLLIRSASVLRIFTLSVFVLFGILSALVSLALEYLWNRLLGDFILSHHSLVFVESFIGVSLIEETSKWLWLVIVFSRWPVINFYSDGILAACAIAAGFNLVEGNLYAVMETDSVNMVIRSFTAVPVHFLFAIVMGFLYARHRIDGKGYLWFSILIPIILHGLYDFFILQQYAELLIGMSLFVLIGCLMLSVWICMIAVKADKLRMAIETQVSSRNEA